MTISSSSFISSLFNNGCPSSERIIEEYSPISEMDSFSCLCSSSSPAEDHSESSPLNYEKLSRIFLDLNEKNQASYNRFCNRFPHAGALFSHNLFELLGQLTTVEDVDSFLLALENFIEVGYLPTILCMRIAFAYQKTMEKYPGFHIRKITKEDQERLKSFEERNASSQSPYLSSNQLRDFPSTVQIAKNQNDNQTIFVVFCQKNCPFRNGGAYKKISLAFDLYRHIFAARATTPLETSHYFATRREMDFYLYLNRAGVEEVPELLGYSLYFGKRNRAKIALFFPFLPKNLFQEVEEARIDRMSVARSLALGLNNIHALGIVHSDFKLENILLEEDKPKIIDFGLSVRTKESLIGMPAFYAPPEYFDAERYHSSLTASPSADLWSFGIILIELFREKLSPEYREWINEFEGEIEKYIKGQEESAKGNLNSLYFPSISAPPSHSSRIEKVIFSLLRIDPSERISAIEAYDMLSFKRRRSF